MCLSIPSQVVKIKGKRAEVQANGHQHQVDLSLLKNVKIGDYLLVHGDLALNKVSKTEAEKIIKMINEPNK